jgi:hypothetical protein
LMTPADDARRAAAEGRRRKAGFDLAPTDDSDSYSSRRQPTRAWSTFNA